LVANFVRGDELGPDGAYLRPSYICDECLIGAMDLLGKEYQRDPSEVYDLLRNAQDVRTMKAAEALQQAMAFSRADPGDVVTVTNPPTPPK